MNSEVTGTIRTTVNTTVMTAITVVLFKVFKWEVSVDDLAPFAPVIIAGTAIFYRASLWLSGKVPAIGYILFGVRTPPTYNH